MIIKLYRSADAIFSPFIANGEFNTLFYSITICHLDGDYDDDDGKTSSA